MPDKSGMEQSVRKMVYDMQTTQQKGDGRGQSGGTSHSGDDHGDWASGHDHGGAASSNTEQQQYTSGTKLKWASGQHRSGQHASERNSHNTDITTSGTGNICPEVPSTSAANWRSARSKSN